MRRCVAIGVAVALFLASAPFASDVSAAGREPPRGPSIGLVVVGSLNDVAFNPLALKGVQDAAAVLGGKVFTAEAKDQTFAARAISSVVRRGAAVVVTVGFLLDTATVDAALANPRVQFIGVDMGAGSIPGNLQLLQYDRAQAGFLAGVIAGSISSTGTIGSVGGLPFYGVTAYINGYRNAAAWVVDPDPAVLVDYAGTFGDPGLGYDMAVGMIGDGADVLFPVAGGTSLGVLDAACEQGVWGIGVDFDYWADYPAIRPCTVSSAELRIASTVERAILRWAAAAPAMQTGDYWNTAANEGITWSTIRNIEASSELEGALHFAYAGLAAGWIDPCAPISCDTP